VIAWVHFGSSFACSLLWGNSLHLFACSLVLWGNSLHLFACSLLWGNSLHLFACSLLWGNSLHLFACSLLWGNSLHLFACSLVLWGNSLHLYCLDFFSYDRLSLRIGCCFEDFLWKLVIGLLFCQFLRFLDAAQKQIIWFAKRCSFGLQLSSPWTFLCPHSVLPKDSQIHRQNYLNL
jgi:hypothetical protein